MDYDKLPISSSGCKGQQTSLPAHGPSYLSPSLISVSSFSPSLSSSPPLHDPQNRKAQDLRVSVLLGRAALATAFFRHTLRLDIYKLSKSTKPSPSYSRYFSPATTKIESYPRNTVSLLTVSPQGLPPVAALFYANVMLRAF